MGLEWMCREVADCPRNRDYQARTDRSIDDALATFDLEQGLCVPAGQPAVWGPEAWNWDDATRRARRLEPGFLWYYDQSRTTASVIGRMAWCWRQPGSCHYRSEVLLSAIRRGFEAYGKRQDVEGFFQFSPCDHARVWGTHELAWRLEPLIYAEIWAGDALPPAERAAARAMLSRTAAALLAWPCTDPNNRGAVWSAIVALCGHWLGDERYLAAARANWQPIRPRMLQGGQVMEDLGPDSNYSYTGVAYVYLYRLFAEDDSLDEPLCQVQQWFARMRTLGGVPFEGMSSRMRGGRVSKLDDLLPMLERYTPREPFYARLIDRYLGYMDAAGMGHHTNHGCDMRIWAMLEHRPAAVPETPVADPGWFHEFGGEYKTDATLYALVKRRYQACIVLRGALPLKGLQTWAFEDEPPVIHPGAAAGSGTVAWGIDSAALNVSKQPASGVWADRVWRQGDPTVYSMRQEALWTHYVFTPVTTLVLIAGEVGRRVTTWAVNLEVAPLPAVGGGVVTLANQQGRLHFAGGPPQLDLAAAAGMALLRFERRERISRFAFADDSFRWIDGPGGAIGFADRSGAYRVEVTGEDRQSLMAGRLAE